MHIENDGRRQQSAPASQGGYGLQPIGRPAAAMLALIVLLSGLLLLENHSRELAPARLTWPGVAEIRPGSVTVIKASSSSDGVMVYGDGCGFSEEEMEAIYGQHDKTSSSDKEQQRDYFFNGAWMTSRDLNATIEVLKTGGAPPALICILMRRATGDLPCMQQECIIPLYLRPKYSDINVLVQLFVREEYSFIEHYEPCTVLDAGANVGYATLIFAIMFPKANIVSVELSTKNYEMLKLNTKYLSNVVAVKTGLYSQIVDMVMVNGTTKQEGWAYQLHAKEKDQKVHQEGVKTVTVNFLLQLFNLPNFDFVKLDIEGSEKDLFTPDSTNDPQTWLSSTRLLSVELHDKYVQGCTKAAEAALVKFTDFKHGEYHVKENKELVDAIKKK